MDIVSVSSPKYSKDDNSSIDAMVTFDNGETYPYTASAADPMPYGQTLWTALQAGTYGAIAAYVPPLPPPPSPIDPLADLINTLIGNGTIMSNQLQATTISTINTALTASGKTSIAIGAIVP